VEDDVMDSAHRFLMESGPYDGSAKQCPSPDKIRSFRTAPVPGNETVVNLAICGDVGQFPHSEELVARMLRSRDDIDVLILAGDVAYASLDHRRWDTFLDFLDDYPISERVPVMLVPGNHDIEKQENDTEMFMAYENRFRMPRMHPPVMEKYDGPPGLFNMDHPPYPLPYEWGNGYYAFTYGPARVIMINAYASMEANSTQYRWIESELRAVDRTVTPWVLTVLHPPIYNTFSLHQRDPQIVAAKTNLEPLFVEHRVNMVFTGTLSPLVRRS
jgi:acid phosphatase type 7